MDDAVAVEDGQQGLASGSRGHRRIIRPAIPLARPSALTLWMSSVGKR
jgi:hypothetical protein